MCIDKLSLKQFSLFYIYGDPHHRFIDEIWSRVHHFVENNYNLPVFCMGDMNNIMHVNEKLGPCKAGIRRINALCDHVKQCGFIDLGYN
jgi:hypothetical protein